MQTMVRRLVEGIIITFAVLAGPVAAAAEQEALEEIVVTGSHIRRLEQRDLASPLQVVSSSDISTQGAQDIPDITRNLTINTAAQYQVSGLLQPQTAGTANINLRGLGLSSTLVLIDGRRQTLSGISTQDDGSSFVDTNSLVPLIMVDRIEILKDGAAATYGTDAVAGVVNFRTLRQFDGFRVEGNFLTDTASGGYDEYNISGMFGGTFGATSLVVAASYFSRDVLKAGDRSWTAGTATSSLGHPGTYRTSRGFVADPACGVPGTYLTPGGFCGMEITPWFDLMPEEERIGLAANLTQAFSDTVTGRLQLALARNDGVTRATPSYAILRNYPVVPASDPANPFGENVTFFGRILGPTSGELTLLPFDYQTWRIAGELDGELGNGWIWELAATYSSNEADVGNGDTVVSRLQAGLAGVGGPNGDQRYSPFYNANNAPGLAEYMKAESLQQGDASLATADLLVTGDLFEFASGTVGAAVGLQYRLEDLAVDLDDFLNAGDFYTLPGGADFSTDRDVLAAFAEMSVPLHAALELQLALRYEDYGNGLDSVDPKVAVLWTPSASVSVRGSFGTSFRAPSLLQTNGRLGANATVVDPANPRFGPLFRTVSTQGNPELDPEEADVFNLGITLTPVAGLEASLDYWRVDYSNLIVKESPQGLVNQAYADTNAGLTGTEAQLKVIRVDGLITQINSDFINASSVETDGLDLAVHYGWDTGFGQMLLATDWSRVLSYDLQLTATGPEIDGAGSRNASSIGRPIPEWRGNVSAQWTRDRQQAYVAARYIDSYFDDVNRRDIRSQTTVDARWSYSWQNQSGDRGSTTRLSIGGINLLDRDPPPVRTFIGFDVRTHDPRGRLLYLNLAHSF